MEGYTDVRDKVEKDIRKFASKHPEITAVYRGTCVSDDADIWYYFITDPPRHDETLNNDIIRAEGRINRKRDYLCIFMLWPTALSGDEEFVHERVYELDAEKI